LARHDCEGRYEHGDHGRAGAPVGGDERGAAALRSGDRGSICESGRAQGAGSPRCFTQVTRHLKRYPNMMTAILGLTLMSGVAHMACLLDRQNPIEFFPSLPVPDSDPSMWQWPPAVSQKVIKLLGAEGTPHRHL